MIRNYITTAIRALRRHPLTTSINLVGLSIGMAAFLLIMLFVRQELTYDTFHGEADRIYRINRVETLDGVEPEHVAITSGLVGPTLKKDLPEVEKATRALRWFDPMPMAVGEIVLKVDNVLFADDEFFDVFSFELEQGDRATVLEEPQSVVLTPSLAKRLFGEQNPIGQTLVGLNDLAYTVTGIVEEAPENSHLQYQALVSWSSTVPGVGALQFEWANRWMTSCTYTFVTLEAGADPEAFHKKLAGFLERNYAQGADQYSLYPQPLTDVHLGSSSILYQDGADLGNRTYVYIFGVSALLILLIACINFINAKTAIAGDRSREVGVRKSLGASRYQLRNQFIGESVLLTLAAFGVAVMVVETILPLAESIVGKRVAVGLLDDPVALILGLSGAALVGILAGLYPSMVLSRFQPVTALRGSGSDPTGSGVGSALRRVLVASQFSISTVLIGGSVVVIQQTRFLQDLDIGVDKHQVVIVPISDSAIPEHFEVFKSKVLSQPGVLNATASDWVPGSSAATYTIEPEGRPDEENWIVQVVQLSDFDFADTYGIEMASGRFFDARFVTDSANAVVINETLAASLGWGASAAVGKRLDIPGDVEEGYVIGVMKDFNLRSAEYAINPVALFHQPRYGNLSVRVAPGNLTETMSHLESVWKEFENRYPFEYRFVDETFGAMYASQEQLGNMLSIFSGLAVLVACLGLFGLASLLARRRTKEIGIRKTLGASVASILGLLTGEIVKLVILATVVAVPVGYMLSTRWLEGFAYHTEVSPTMFVFIAVGLLAMGLLAVSYQSIRAALADPVNALRYE